MLVGAHELVDFFIYERDKKVVIEANTARALEFLRSSKYEIQEEKLIMLCDDEAHRAFDIIDAMGYSTITQ